MQRIFFCKEIDVQRRMERRRRKVSLMSSMDGWYIGNDLI
jgi:hypothetical protein